MFNSVDLHTSCFSINQKKNVEKLMYGKIRFSNQEPYEYYRDQKEVRSFQKCDDDNNE